MNYNEIKEALESVKGGSFIGLDTKSEVKLKGGKKNPMQGRVTKITTGANTMVFATESGSPYEAMVKRRLEEEGKDPESFTVGPRAWGTRIKGTPFIEHKDNHYLEVIYISPGKTEYFLDGEPIEKDEIEGLGVDTEKTEKGQGGLENKVVIRTFKTDSIVAIRTNGQEYKTKENE